MSEQTNSKESISTEPYRGVRDFFPEDQSIRRYLFAQMRNICEKFGYQEYSFSPLEPTELYQGKTSEEIVSEQTYTFTDRGGRSVTLRPEITPSVARMIASRAKSTSFPLRWYSIERVYRYERPQKGRLREHTQLNADIFGSTSLEADIETITLAFELLRSFGLSSDDFEIHIMNREILKEALLKGLDLDEETYKSLLRVIDAKEKMDQEEFETKISDLLGSEKAQQLHEIWNDSPDLPETVQTSEAFQQLKHTKERLSERGISNVKISKDLVRGFDYYTGMIFEVFDTHPENTRALFGGGRYDDLMKIFDAPPVPAVGFGMGDVTLYETLKIRNLLPSRTNTADVFVAVLDKSATTYAYRVAKTLRDANIRVVQNVDEGRAAKFIKRAQDAQARWILFVGSEEQAQGTITVKDLASDEQSTIPIDQVSEKIHEK